MYTTQYTNRSPFNENNFHSHIHTLFISTYYIVTHSLIHSQTSIRAHVYRFNRYIISSHSIILSMCDMCLWHFVCTYFLDMFVLKYKFECRTNHWWTRWPSSIQSSWLKARIQKAHVLLCVANNIEQQAHTHTHSHEYPPKQIIKTPTNIRP